MDEIKWRVADCIYRACAISKCYRLDMKIPIRLFVVDVSSNRCLQSAVESFHLTVTLWVI